MRRRLAIVAVAVTAMIVLAFVVPLGLLVRRQAADRAIRSAENDAQAVAASLAVAATTAGSLDSALAGAVLASFGDPPGVAVFLDDGSVAGAPPADARSDVAASVSRATAGAAFVAYTRGGAEVLIPVFGPDEGVAVVRAEVAGGDLRRGVAAAWFILAGLGLLVIIVAVAAADRLARSIVRPISGLSQAAVRLGEGDLSTRVTPSGPPEIAAVADRFNDLAGRLQELLAAERESIADLSHRLRTPLTALRLQVEAVSDPATRSVLLEDVAGLESSVDALIADVRSPARAGSGTSDLVAVARGRVKFWKVVAGEQHRDLATELPPAPVRVALGLEEAGSVLDTLVENALVHTPPGAPIRVTVQATDLGGALIVEDGGSGFADLSAVARGTSGAGSTGLGLDIVRRAAEGSGGSLGLGRSAELGGARIEARFGGTR